MDGREEMKMNNCIKQQMAKPKARKHERNKTKSQMWADTRMNDKNRKEKRQNPSIKKNVV